MERRHPAGGSGVMGKIFEFLRYGVSDPTNPHPTSRLTNNDEEKQQSRRQTTIKKKNNNQQEEPKMKKNDQNFNHEI